MERVGIAGFLHESNTFSPLITTRQQFKQASLTKGETLLQRWQGSHHELGGFLEGAETFGFQAVPLMATFAIPAGTITSEAFNQLSEEKILIVKGVVAPRAAYEPIAREIILVDTPGSTSANPANFPYRRRRRPLYPLEPETQYPT